MTPADLKLCKRDENRPLVKDGTTIVFVTSHDDERAICYHSEGLYRGEYWGTTLFDELSPVPPDEPVPVPPPQWKHESDPPKRRIIQPGERFIYFAADFKDPGVHTNASVVETQNEHWPIVPAQDKPADCTDENGDVWEAGEWKDCTGGASAVGPYFSADGIRVYHGGFRWTATRKVKPVPQWNVFAKLQAAERENAELRAKLATAEESLRAEQASGVNLARYCNDPECWTLPMSGNDLMARDTILALRETNRHEGEQIIAQQSRLTTLAQELERERATVRELQHKAEACNGSCDISLARRQVGPDGVVPGNARECAELWEQESARLRAKLATAERDRDDAMQEADADDIYGGDLPAPPHGPPPEGRTVEPEMREPRGGDTFWLRGTGWTQAANDHTARRYVLRPLPPKPVGVGWEWRRPKGGDKCQALNCDGEPITDGYFTATRDWVSTVYDDDTGRDLYRWCRKPTPASPPDAQAKAGAERPRHLACTLCDHEESSETCLRHSHRGTICRKCGGTMVTVRIETGEQGSPQWMIARRYTATISQYYEGDIVHDEHDREAVPVYTEIRCAHARIRIDREAIARTWIAENRMLPLLRDAQRLYSLGVSRAPHGEPEADAILTRLRAAVERLEQVTP